MAGRRSGPPPVLVRPSTPLRRRPAPRSRPRCARRRAGAAPAAGVVSFAGTVPTGGKTIAIETPGGQTATLLHLGSIGVKRGATVEEAAVVGTVGPSGATDLAEPFVYFGVRTTSDPQGYVDPLSFLPARPSLPAAAGPGQEVAAQAGARGRGGETRRGRGSDGGRGARSGPAPRSRACRRVGAAGDNVRPDDCPGLPAVPSRRSARRIEPAVPVATRRHRPARDRSVPRRPRAHPQRRRCHVVHCRFFPRCTPRRGRRATAARGDPAASESNAHAARRGLRIARGAAARMLSQLSLRRIAAQRGARIIARSRAGPSRWQKPRHPLRRRSSSRRPGRTRAGQRHLGHVAGFGSRRTSSRATTGLRGNDVLMVSGTDEHGTPVMVAADREGVSPREIADRYNELIRDDLRDLGIIVRPLHAHDDTRTTSASPRTSSGRSTSTAPSSSRRRSARSPPTTGNTLPDRYIEGTCPICGYPEARGDQCDNCGNQLDPTDLIDPRSRIDGAPPEFRETKHLFLDLPQFADQLRAWIEQQDDWRPNVRNFSLALLDELEAARDHPRPRLGRPDSRSRATPRRRQADLRLVRRGDRLPLGRGRVGGRTRGARTRGASGGRTRTPRTTTSWARTTSSSTPSSGRACCSATARAASSARARDRSQLPDDVVASEFLTMEGKQFSTSRGSRDLRPRLPRALRPRPRCATSSRPPAPRRRTRDFTWAEFVRRNNDELVANWGNLVNRTLTNAHRNFGEVPQPGELTERTARCSPRRGRLRRRSAR